MIINPRSTSQNESSLRPAVIFDLDGTLVDSIGDLQAAVNLTLKSLGRHGLDRAAVAPMIGDGAKVLLERALSVTGGMPEDFAALLARFLERYEAQASNLTRPYPDVPDVLATLRADGWALAICTNKPQATTRRLLAELGLDHHFTAVLGGDSLPVGKPDPAPVMAALRAVGGDARRSAMVGDHANDLAAGQAAGIAVILARYGYGGASTTGLAPSATIDSFAELPAALARLFE
jgi:phosphoglycolate phosphatase